MNKVAWKPGNMIYPLPAVMVSCGDKPENYNIITVAWVGNLSTNPPMCYISLRKSRHSYLLISEAKEFVINLTTGDLLKATDWCGVKSGKEYNKFEEMNLTPQTAQKVKAPLIKESPLNIECVLKEIKELGSHDMFIAEIVAINADRRFIDPETNAFDLQKANLLAYSHGKYYSLGKKLGFFGFSVQKKRK